MNIKPLSDRVVVKVDNAAQMTKGGLHIPEPAQEKPQKATVVEVGPGKVTEDGKTIPMSVQVGDSVMFGKYSGTEVIVDGEKYLIMRESDLLAVVDSGAQISG